MFFLLTPLSCAATREPDPRCIASLALDAVEQWLSPSSSRRPASCLHRQAKKGPAQVRTKRGRSVIYF